MNWALIIIAGIALVALIVFLVRRNAKGERDFENRRIVITTKHRGKRGL